VFVPIRSTRRYDPDHITIGSVTVAYDEHSQHRAHAEQDESRLNVRVIRVVDQQTVLIRESSLGLLERHAVLSPVSPVLPFVPLEAK
jgi:hypothetical protein